MNLCYLSISSALVLCLLQVGGECKADDDVESTSDIEDPQEWVRVVIEPIEEEFITNDKAMLKEKLGPDSVFIKEKLKSEVEAAWRGMLPTNDFGRLILDILFFISNPSKFNEHYKTEFTYNSDCKQFHTLAQHFIQFQSLQDSNPGAIKNYTGDILKSALKVCVYKMVHMDGVYVCNPETVRMIEEGFKVLESKRRNVNYLIRSNIEESASVVKKECNGLLLNHDDIRKLIPFFKSIY